MIWSGARCLSRARRVLTGGAPGNWRIYPLVKENSILFNRSLSADANCVNWHSELLRRFLNLRLSINNPRIVPSARCLHLSFQGLTD